MFISHRYQQFARVFGHQSHSLGYWEAYQFLKTIRKVHHKNNYCQMKPKILVFQLKTVSWNCHEIIIDDTSVCQNTDSIKQWKK